MKERVLFWGVLSAVFALGACSKAKQAPPAVSSVVVTNIVTTNQSIFNPTGSVSTVILLTNGIYFGHEADTRMISVDIPGHYAEWIYYDAVGNKPRKIIHQFYGTNRYWLTDLDADGVPDTRINYNEGPNHGSKSIFIKGEWVDADVRGTNANAVMDQRPTKFQFSNGKWREEAR